MMAVAYASEKARSFAGWEWVRDVAINDPTLTVGRRIQRIRQACHWTLADLGARIGASDRTICDWERDLGLPNVTFLFRVAVVWRCSMEGLLTGGGAWTPYPARPVMATDRRCGKPANHGKTCARRVRERGQRCPWHTGVAS